jgi:cytochrome c553
MNARKLPGEHGTPARTGARIASGLAAKPLAWAKGLVMVAGMAAVASGQVAAQEIKGDAKAAETKISACIGCHAIPGYRSTYPMVYSVPMINGQSAKYIENALTAYRNGDRSHPTMRAIAGSLTDQDIADLAAYYGKPVEQK